MTNEQERLKRAAAAGKRAGTSPYERQAKASGAWKWWMVGFYTFYIGVAVWLGEHGAPWWMTVGFWVTISISVITSTVFYPLANKVKRRKMLLAREQVHRVRKLDADDPVGLGLGHLFDADPMLDHLSVEAGVRFALSAVNAVLDEVEKSTPEPTWLGYTIDDNGKARGRMKK